MHQLLRYATHIDTGATETPFGTWNIRKSMYVYVHMCSWRLLCVLPSPIVTYKIITQGFDINYNCLANGSGLLALYLN